MEVFFSERRLCPWHYFPERVVDGLAMICHGHALRGSMVTITEARDNMDLPCFSCQEPLGCDTLTFTVPNNYCCAQLHKQCAALFIERRNRAIEHCKNKYEAHSYENVFDAMKMCHVRLFFVRPSL
jgi:hypothetical protein